MKEPMPFEKFKAIMTTIMTFDEKRNRFSKFIEEEISTSTYCIVDFGSEVEAALIGLLADEFKCWFAFQEREFDWWNSTNNIDNDIENWLYSLSDNKTITVKDKEFDVNSLESFYNFLVMQYNDQCNLTDSKI